MTEVKSRRSFGGLVIVVLVAIFMWWAYGDEGAPPPSTGGESPVTTSESAGGFDESLPGDITAPFGTDEGSTETSVTESTDTTSGDAETTETTSISGDVDPESGLPWVSVDALPPEAHTTLDLIASDGPYPYDQDGATFENREGILPDHQVGYYREFTVDTPGEDDRGARRIVVGDGGDFYYTEDHYESFTRIEP